MENPIDFSKRSRRAIFIFVLLFIVIALIPRLLSFYSIASKVELTQTDFEEKKFSKKTKFFKKEYEYKKFSSKFKKPARKFDPNSYSPSDWMQLGMSQKQADLIIKFGKRGFYSHEDLQRVFVISDKFFAVIKDSLIYPVKPEKESYQKEKVVKEIKIIELNTCSEEDLLTLNGIGAFFAKNILKKRGEFGGFISKEQLLEVWKFDEEKLRSIENFIRVDKNNILQFHLNTVTVEELKKHPYINWNVANSIVKLRTQIGEYKTIEEIKRSVLIDEELFNKLKDYLTL